MGTTDARCHLKGRHAWTWRIPEWLAASGLSIGKQSTSFNIAQALSQKDSTRLQQRQISTRGQVPSSQAPHIVELINSTGNGPVIHQGGLLERRANHVAQSPFSTSDTQNKPTSRFFFPLSSRRSDSQHLPGLNPLHDRGHVKETSIFKPFHRLQFRQSDSQHLPGLNPFRDKGHVKETLILKPIRVTRIQQRETTKLHVERDLLKEASTNSSPSLSPPFSCSSE